MAEVVMRAPRFEHVLASQANKLTSSIAVTFLDADKKKYAVEISTKCAALTLAAIAAHLGEILSSIPAEDHPAVQPIVGKSVQTAMRDNGALALILTLESGAELPLEFPRGDLAKLSSQFAELAKLADPKQHH